MIVIMKNNREENLVMNESVEINGLAMIIAFWEFQNIEEHALLAAKQKILAISFENGKFTRKAETEAIKQNITLCCSFCLWNHFSSFCYSHKSIYSFYHCGKRLYDNSDQRQIRTKYRIRTKDKFGPNFEIRPKLFR